MSTNALRAAVLAANLILLGVVAWTSYVTFRVMEPARWHLKPPDVRRFEPPAIQDDPLQREREIYNQIATVLERPKAAEAPPPVDPGPAAPPPPSTPPAASLLVVMTMVGDPDSGLRSTALLGLPGRPPGQEVEKPFREGMELTAYDEFKQFRDVVVKSISTDAVVLADRSGKELARLTMKRGEAPR